MRTHFLYNTNLDVVRVESGNILVSGPLIQGEAEKMA